MSKKRAQLPPGNKVGFRPRSNRVIGTKVDSTLQSYADTPWVIYSDWLLANGGINGKIGNTTAPSSLRRVAVIGAGVSGLTAAFELSKIGYDVVVLTAPDTLYPEDQVKANKASGIGGRFRSVPFINSDGSPSSDIAELGAMRFPPSEETLFYYINQFGIQVDTTFPDPGKVPTWINYKGVGQNWSDSSKAPVGFETVYNGWITLATQGISHNGVGLFLSGPEIATLALKPEANIAIIYEAWQQYLTEFGQDSFYSGLYKIFGPKHKWDVPGGVVWTAEDFQKFAALGIGSGGFGSLYGIGFCYIYRLLTNQLETDQVFVPGGISQVTDNLAAGLKANGGKILHGIKVIELGYQDGKPQIIAIKEDGSPVVYSDFQKVIIATTTRSAQLMGLNKNTNKGSFSQNTLEAVNNIHVISSSKLFLRTNNFWKNDPNFIRGFQTDTFLQQLYTLDYGDASGSGVVLITYTWEDNAVKSQALRDHAILKGSAYPRSRFEQLVLDIDIFTKGTPIEGFSQYLTPFTGDINNDLKWVDWQSTDYFNGAFTLAQAGQDGMVKDAYYDFLKAGTSSDNGIFLAGDCISFTGGWGEGAFHTGLNAACAVVVSFGDTLFEGGVFGNSPFGSHKFFKDAYDYYGDRGKVSIKDPAKNIKTKPIYYKPRY
ncbi:MAG: NAD(P)/FAD-dependent oxidoreductase [Methylacidiphilales bacterium]|nr:NAD(P)/FAD-dependent oxidoreductase [Candidatus Methylacidiphilales bacterium]